MRRYEEWEEKYYRPWSEAKTAYEDEHDVIVVDAQWREFYKDARRVVFVEGMPELPDEPWDEDAL